MLTSIAAARTVRDERPSGRVETAIQRGVSAKRVGCALHALAHTGRKHAELVAILGHGSACNLDTGLLENLNDCLIREWIFGVFTRDQLLDLVFNSPRLHIVTIAGG